jgi:hypothetical protein
MVPTQTLLWCCTEAADAFCTAGILWHSNAPQITGPASHAPVVGDRTTGHVSQLADLRSLYKLQTRARVAFVKLACVFSFATQVFVLYIGKCDFVSYI